MYEIEITQYIGRYNEKEKKGDTQRDLFLKTDKLKFWIDQCFRLSYEENRYTPEWLTDWLSEGQIGFTEKLEIFWRYM